jgi:hypothetical protein
MSLLHQQPTETLDDAAQGESFTKGTSHIVIAAVVATIVVSIAIAIYFFAGQTPAPVNGVVEAVWAHPMHVESSGFDANGAPMPKESFDQVYVFTQVKLTNQTKGPLFLSSILTNATLGDGIHSSYAASATDYERIFLAYPTMPVPHGKALPLDTTIEAGQSVEGTVVSAFHIGKQDWDARKDLNFTFAFRYQPSLTLTPRVPVTEE